MMKISCLLTSFLLSLSLFGQSCDSVNINYEKPIAKIQVVETPPLPKPCLKLEGQPADKVMQCVNTYVMRHVSKNFKFPKEAKKLGVQAKIYVNFVVEKDASISGVEVVRGAIDAYQEKDEKVQKAARALDAEAVRAVKTLRFKKAPHQQGKPVRMSFTVPVDATLS